LEILPGSRLDPSEILNFTATRQRESKAIFDKFSAKQASAIRDWLLAALSWNESHLPEDEITAALEYWSKAR
jgi:hypothetical protein